MDATRFKVMGGSASPRQGATFTYYPVVLNGVAQASWNEVGAAWTEGSGYLEKVGNGSDYGYSSLVISKSTFALYIQMSISDLASANSYILLQDQTTVENFFAWFNGDVGGNAHLASISTSTWSGVGYARLDSAVTSGGIFWSVIKRQGDAMYWGIHGDVTTVNVSRTGIDDNPMLTGILPDTKTVRVYNYIIGA